MPHRANRTFVTNSDALTAWTPIARDLLLTTAQTYHAVVEYRELATEVQERSGIAANQELDAWIDKLLERVAKTAAQKDEPPLASLCVHQDGTIRQGYHDTPRAHLEAVDIPIDETDDEQVAARDRLLCYRAYATDLPTDGGHPKVAIRVASTRERAPRRPSTTTRVAAEPRMREVTCTSCWMIVPARETCSSCGAALPAT